MFGPGKTNDIKSNTLAGDYELAKELIKLRVHALTDILPEYKFKDSKVRDTLIQDLQKAIHDPAYDRKSLEDMIAEVGKALQETKFSNDFTPPAIKKMKVELHAICVSYKNKKFAENYDELSASDKKKLEDAINQLTLNIVRAIPANADIPKKLCMVNAIRSCKNMEEVSAALQEMSGISKQLKAVVDKVSAKGQKLSSAHTSIFQSSPPPQRSVSEPVKKAEKQVAPPRPTTPYPKRK